MRLSVVLPLLNESENLPELHARLSATLERIGCDYELIFVNDGSSDGSQQLLEQLASSDTRVKYVSLSRNFGHEIASTAGLDRADGDAVVLMDADLQDPPELIERMLEPWVQGYDVVYAQRLYRHGESCFKRGAAYLFYRLMRRLSSLDLPLDTGDFRLMDRRVVDAFRQFSESQRFVRGIVSWMGFRQTAVQYERPARHAGTGKYSIAHLIKLALDAIMGFSVMPLRLATALGALCVAGSLLGAVLSCLRSWLAGIESNSATNLMLGFLMFGGVQLLSIGILGEYIGRVHRDVLRRPLYLVDRCQGWQEKTSESTRGRVAAQERRVLRDPSLHTRQPAA